MTDLAERVAVVLRKKLESHVANSLGGGRGVRISADTGQFTSYKLVTSHELFESLLLVNLAQDLGSLSRQEAAELYSSVFAPFMASLVPKAQDASATTEYVKHSAESKELLRSFDKFSKTLEQGMRDGDFRAQSLRVNDPRALKSRFEKILLLQIGMITEPEILAYLDAVKYRTDPGWDFIFQSIPSPEEVACADGERKPNAAAVLHGFLRLIGYQSEIKKTLDSTSELLDYTDSTHFTEWSRDIFNWRLDFRSQRSFQRFEKIRGVLVENCTAEVPLNERARIRERLTDIFDEVCGLALAHA